MTPDIQTVSGHRFNFLTPEESTFDIEDVAHALSHICRFTGHTREFYSVAQHSVLVSRLVPPEFALQGLMHDAAEAFIGDVSSPLKRMLPEYKVIEARVEEAVFARFGLPAVFDPSVKDADLVALATERRDLMLHTGDIGIDWSVLQGRQPVVPKVFPMAPAHARQAFLDRWWELTR